MKYQLEVPKEISNCKACPLVATALHGDKFCYFNYKDIEDYPSRPDWCPLTEVKTDCELAEKTDDGRCLGYGHGDDDEPIEMCLKCRKQVSFEDDDLCNI